MSNISSKTLTAQQPNPRDISNSAITPPASTAIKVEPVPIADFAPSLRVLASARDYSYAFLGGITEGHYTEF